MDELPQGNDEVLSDGPDLIALRQVLEAAGWDAIAGEGEVAARREHPPTPGVWSLVVDGSGRFRLRAQRETASPLAFDLQREGRSYQLLLEEDQVLTLRGRIEDSAGLIAVLADWDALADVGAWYEK